jgi:hypothetical protein
MEKQKVATRETQVERAKSMTRIMLVIMFVLCLSVPLVNLLFGLGFIIWLTMTILARSAQRAADFGWLVVGSALCLFGFFLPALFEGPTSSGMMHGWLLEALLNTGVAIFILTGRLGHLLFTPEAPA